VKKTISGVIGLPLVLAAVIFIGPMLINWNNYKSEIATRTKAATGRDLTISGNIQVSILPTPALIAHDVILSNLKGAAAPNMVRMRSLDVRIALGPLLGGNIQVDAIKLVDPVIELEALADGRKNWEFSPPDKKKNNPLAATRQGAGPDKEALVPDAVPAMRLDNFTIENATLVYRDQQAGTVERVNTLNAKIAAASLTGPIESSGTLVARGVFLKFTALIGKIIHGRTAPVSLTLQTDSHQGILRLNGTLVSLAKTPKFRGRLMAEGDSLAAIIATTETTGTLPGFAGQAFSLGGTVIADAKGAVIEDLIMRLGDAEATGNATVELGKTVAVAGRLTVNHVNLDKWLALPAVQSSKGSKKPKKKTGRATASITLDPPQSPPKPKAVNPSLAAAMAIPANLAGSINLAINNVTYKGAIVRQVRASAELSSGEITISQLAAQFPGGSEVAAFGFGSIVDGQPKFEGDVELSISDVRSVMGWLGVPAPPIASDRLRKLTFAGNITASPKQLQFAKLSISLDSSRLTGWVTVALRKRPDLRANLTLDRINLDAYLAAPEAEKTKNQTSAGDGAKGEAKGAPAEGKSPTGDPLAVLSALDSFDANLKLNVKTLVYRKAPIKGLTIDGTLLNGTLQLRQASVADLAGTSAKVSGTLNGLGGIPSMKIMRFDVRARDTLGLFRMAGIVPPVAPRSLGKVSLKGKLDGGLLVPKFDLTVSAAGATVGLKGKMTLLPTPVVDAALSARHDDLVRLLGLLQVDYRPAGPIGGIDMAATVKGDASRLMVGGLKGSVGSIRLQGDATLVLDGVRPKIAANLTTGNIVIDPFLPATRTAGLARAPGRSYGHPGLVLAAWPTPPNHERISRLLHTVATTVGERWSSQPLDLAVLGSMDADIKLKSTAVAFQAYRLENADLAATLTGGILNVSHLTGTLFGGALEAGAAVNANGRPKLDATLAVKGVDVGRATGAFTGKALTSGTMRANLKLATAGNSVADMVGALSGIGGLVLSRIDVKAAGKGTALAGALDLITGLNKPGRLLGDKKKGGSLADISGTFRIDKGVANSSDLALSSNLVTGQAKGSIDLPNWLIDVKGEVRLSQNLLMLPLNIKGTLDSPNVKLDTRKMLSGGVSLPSVDKLLGKKGIGSLLQKILPGQQPEQQQPQSKEPPPAEKKFRPEDLLKQLFKL